MTLPALNPPDHLVDMWTKDWQEIFPDRSLSLQRYISTKAADWQLKECARWSIEKVTEPSDEDLYDLAEFFNGDPIPAMRRALELWGRPAAPPVEGEEVGELVANLRRLAPQNPLGTADPTITRAAALLEQFSAQSYPQPVPVSERLPGAEDCDASGMVWWGRNRKWVVLNTPNAQVLGYTHWLPAHALPIPATTPAGQEGA